MIITDTNTEPGNMLVTDELNYPWRILCRNYLIFYLHAQKIVKSTTV